MKLFGKIRNLHVDVISSNCPLLMGRPTLEKVGLILNFRESTAIVDDQKYSLQRSEKGHYLVSLFFDENHENQHVFKNIEKDDEVLCAIDEVNEIYFAEEETVGACEVVYSVTDTSKKVQ